MPDRPPSFPVPAPAAPPVRERGDACPGALRLHAADDGALARVRIPAGRLTCAQAGSLARAARELGDGRIDLTSRGNLQLRGLTHGCGGELAALLRESGLLPSALHERARNVVASPLSGLDGRGAADVQPWAAELDARLCASGAAAGLSGRFLFALDDGRGDVAALGPDVTLTALPGGEALLRTGTEPESVRIPAARAAEAAVGAAEIFLTRAARSGPGAWRVGELPPAGPSFAALLARLWRAPRVYGAEPGGEGDVCAPGLVPGPGGAVALSVGAPLGRLTLAQWSALADAASRGDGGLRVTPWRGVVVPGLSAGSAARCAGVLREAGLVTGADSPWRGVGACAGLRACAKAHADVRADAAASLGEGPGGLPVHWSGCERRCGRPRGARVDVVADEDGYTVTARAEGATAGATARVPYGSGRELAAAVAAARSTR